MDRPTLQSSQSIVICAPLQTVWEFNQDLGKIAEYHPRVSKVEFVSGKSKREAGVCYTCHMKDGKNTCTERDIEVIPMNRIVTMLPEDTLGIGKLLPDYVVETTFTPLDENTTKMEFSHYYSTNSLKAKMANLVARPKIEKESQETLAAIKNAIEHCSSSKIIQ